MGEIHVFYACAFGIVMDTYSMWDYAYKWVYQWMDIMHLAETLEHDIRIQGLGNYNVHSLIWLNNPRQLRGRDMRYLMKRKWALMLRMA